MKLTMRKPMAYNPFGAWRRIVQHAGQRLYHIALLREGDTVVVQMREDAGQLSPSRWQYHGAYVTTKERVRARSESLLSKINREYGTAFTRLVVR